MSATDIRLSVGLPTHPKTKKLRKLLGNEAAWALVCLFVFAAQNKPDGDLSGMDVEDIEIAVDWEGEDGAFVAALVKVGFLNGEEGSYKIHDWAEHNGWVYGSEHRSDRSKFAVLCRHYGRDYAEREMPEFARRKPDARESIPDPANSAPVEVLGSEVEVLDSTNRNTDSESSNTPSPYPSPYPSLKNRKDSSSPSTTELVSRSPSPERPVTTVPDPPVTVPDPPSDPGQWLRWFNAEHGLEIDPLSRFDRRVFWPLATRWCKAGIGIEQMRAAIRRALSESREPIAFLPAYVDRVIANQNAPPPTMTAAALSTLAAARTIFGTENEARHEPGRIIDITPATAAGNAGGGDIPRTPGKLRIALPEPVEDGPDQ